MNPNICTICERAFSKVKHGRHISEDATILFCDIRDFTTISEKLDPIQLARVVSAFHDICAEAIWARNGIVNKQMGDGVMAIFNFPIKAKNHTAQAVDAAIDIQLRFSQGLVQFLEGFGLESTNINVGIGIHTGQVEIGEFGRNRSDFTAIGCVVNIAARLEASANPNEIVLSSIAAARAPDQARFAIQNIHHAEGISRPIEIHVLNLKMI